MDTTVLLRHAQFHGAKRLIECRHRFYWGIALLFLLWAALSNLSMTVIRFLQSPTSLVTVDTVSSKIPFPSVLVCPEVYYPDYKIEGLLQNATYPPGMNADTIKPIIKQLAAFFSPDAPYTVEELSLVQEFLEYNGLDVENTGERLTTSCKETFYKCRFRWNDLKCTDIFHMELTVYGYCCVFNGRSLKRELREKIRRGSKLREWFTTETGPFASLVIAVNQSQYLNNVDLTYKWLVIQNNRMYVDTTKNGTPLSPGAEMWSSFHTSSLHVSDDSLFLGDSLRGCQIENKQLKYYPYYNKKYCLLECKMEITIRNCQCLLPFHLRPSGVPICHARSLLCARISMEEFDEDACDCPFTCEYQSTIIDTATYDFSSVANPYDSFYEGLNLSRATVARIFIKSHQTTSYLRHPIFSFHDLFSQLGGVFNVFFGCSILSIAELLQLAWHSSRTSKEKKLNKISPQTKQRRKKKPTFFGLCCKSKKGRVGKRLPKKKVFFLNTPIVPKDAIFFNMKMLDLKTCT